MRKCPRCSCGLTPSTVVCDFCGAVLAHVARAGDEVTSIACLACGRENAAYAALCSCGRGLQHSCPRCDQKLDADAAGCTSCGLERTAFYAYCEERARQQTAERHRKRRVADVGGDVISWVFIVSGIALAAWEGYRGERAYQWTMLIMAGGWFLLWALIKFVK